jgi:hypothetical protein
MGQGIPETRENLRRERMGGDETEPPPLSPAFFAKK